MATEVKGLAGAGICAEDSDPAGWGTFVGFGFVYEGLSFLRDVRRVPPASITVYDPRRERASGRPPGGGPRGAPRPRSTPSRRTRSPRRSCVRSTPTASTYPGQGTLLMSGGFESRFVLCALTRAGAAAQALILSNVAIEPDDADGRSCAPLAPSGLPPPLSRPTPACTPRPPTSITSWRARCRRRASGSSSPSSACTCGRSSGRSGRARRRATASRRAISRAAASRLPPRGGEPARLGAIAGGRACLRPAAIPGHGGGLSRRRWRTRAVATAPTASASPSSSSGAACAAPRSTPSWSLLTGSPFTPGLSKEFWAAAASIPAEVKREYRLYLRLLERHFPEALGIPFISGSTMVRAGRGSTPSICGRASRAASCG